MHQREYNRVTTTAICSLPGERYDVAFVDRQLHSIEALETTLDSLLPGRNAMAGTLAKKRRVPASAGTLPTHGTLFIALLVGTIVVVGGLTFFPALTLGPVVEHFALQAGASY